MRHRDLILLAWRYSGGDPEVLRVNEDIFESDPNAPVREVQRLAR